MGNFTTIISIVHSFFLFVSSATSLSTLRGRQTYIIHMDKSAMPAPFSTHHHWHMSTLSSLSSPDGDTPTHLYTYNHVVDDFSASLSQTHHDWSSAAIRSAMMTTAYLLDNANSTITEMTTEVSGTPLDFGSGPVNPNKAMDPGLVCDIEVQDYINYLCALNYTSLQIRVLTGTSNFTSENANLDLNYPSFMIILNNTKSASFTFKRVSTNVDDTSSIYNAAVKAPAGVKVVVQPETVTFARKYGKAEFNLTLSINLGITVSAKSNYLGNFGYLTWHENNGKHMVEAPLSVHFLILPRLEVSLSVVGN